MIIIYQPSPECHLTHPSLDSEESQRPITAHHPTTQSLSPTIQTLRTVQFSPILTTPISTMPGTKPPEEIQESIHDLFEFIDMLALTSPRVQTTDNVDSFISRYQVPESVSEASGASVKVVTWTGLLSTQWILELLCTIMYVRILSSNPSLLVQPYMLHTTLCALTYGRRWTNNTPEKSHVPKTSPALIGHPNGWDFLLRLIRLNPQVRSMGIPFSYSLKWIRIKYQKPAMVMIPPILRPESMRMMMMRS